MSNHKSPGLDGFPAEFYKMIWLNLKYFILNTLNESFENKILPLTMNENPKARIALHHLIQSYSLVVAFRELYPTKKKQYTWCRTNPNIKARLNYFFISTSLIDLTNNIEVNSGYRTDHKIQLCQLR
jgi:hypothetical protein